MLTVNQTYDSDINTLNLNPLPRKSGSIYLSFTAQMCNLSNFDQKECMGIALHHAGNKDTFTCQNVTLHFMQIFSAKICSKMFMSQNQKQNILPQNLDAKYAPKKFTPLKLDAKI